MSAIRRSGMSACVHAWRSALQWRLLVLWVLATLIPTAVVALPLWGQLDVLLDHSVHSAEWARHFDALAAGDVYSQMRSLKGAAVVSLVVTMLLSPLLTGMAVTALRATRSASFAELLNGGAREFWPMSRMLLWALLPFGIAAAIGGGAMAWASSFADMATLQSHADVATRTAIGILVALLLLAHALVESARAQFAADPDLRSAGRALRLGAGMLWRRPLATLAIYLVISIAGYAAALLLGVLRVHTIAAGWPGLAGAMALTQLIVATLAWQRTARLAGLKELAMAASTATHREAASSSM